MNGAYRCVFSGAHAYGHNQSNRIHSVLFVMQNRDLFGPYLKAINGNGTCGCMFLGVYACGHNQNLTSCNVKATRPPTLSVAQGVANRLTEGC
jgi:hypothetical protein